ncbi:MAG: hypothetical protein R3F43_20165 [bacterium]
MRPGWTRRWATPPRRCRRGRSRPRRGPPRGLRLPADCPGGDCVDGFCLYASPVRCLFLDACDDQGGCPDGQACVDGTCQVQCPAAETCGGFQAGLWCYEPCELERSCRIRPRPCTGNIECPKGSVCKEDRCINACEHDGQCPEDGYCFEGSVGPSRPASWMATRRRPSASRASSWRAWGSWASTTRWGCRWPASARAPGRATRTPSPSVAAIGSSRSRMCGPSPCRRRTMCSSWCGCPCAGRRTTC